MKKTKNLFARIHIGIATTMELGGNVNRPVFVTAGDGSPEVTRYNVKVGFAWLKAHKTGELERDLIDDIKHSRRKVIRDCTGRYFVGEWERRLAILRNDVGACVKLFDTDGFREAYEAAQELEATFVLLKSMHSRKVRR